jgi:hypothetical protein
MSTEQIRETIERAITTEQRSGQLLSHFEENLDSLRSCLLLPKVNASTRLVTFVTRYVEYVPDFLDCIGDACRQADTLPSVAPFLNMAEDFFLLPPSELDQHSGLLALMDEAYLAQRLFEEINDRHILQHSIPLLPVDMTRANIIVHHLIGDALGNRLNILIEEIAARLLHHNRLLAGGNILGLQNLSARELPCLSRDENIDLLPPVSASY